MPCPVCIVKLRSPPLCGFLPLFPSCPAARIRMAASHAGRRWPTSSSRVDAGLRRAQPRGRRRWRSGPPGALFSHVRRSPCLWGTGRCRRLLGHGAAGGGRGNRGCLSATFWGYLTVEWGRSCRGWWSGVACGELPENWHKTRVIAGCGLRTRGVYPTVVWEAAVGERALLFVVGS